MFLKAHWNLCRSLVSKARTTFVYSLICFVFPPHTSLPWLPLFPGWFSPLAKSTGPWGEGGELFRVVSGIFGNFFWCFRCLRSRSRGLGAQKLTITFSFGVFQIYWVSGEPFMVLFGTANLIYKLSGVRESSLQRFRAPRIPSKGFWAPRVSFSAPSIA